MRIKLRVFYSTAKTKDGHEFPTWYTYDVKDNRYSVKAAKASGLVLPSYNFTLSVDPRGLYLKKDEKGFSTLYVRTSAVEIEKLESVDGQNLGNLFEEDVEAEVEETF